MKISHIINKKVLLMTFQFGIHKNTYELPMSIIARVILAFWVRFLYLRQFYIRNYNKIKKIRFGKAIPGSV
jgi:hypothetical protein